MQVRETEVPDTQAGVGGRRLEDQERVETGPEGKDGRRTCLDKTDGL